MFFPTCSHPSIQSCFFCRIFRIFLLLHSTSKTQEYKPNLVVAGCTSTKETQQAAVPTDKSLVGRCSLRVTIVKKT